VLDPQGDAEPPHRDATLLASRAVPYHVCLRHSLLVVYQASGANEGGTVKPLQCQEAQIDDSCLPDNHYMPPHVR
jgi:hypothetical protein